jgi:hypothetical protein
MSRTHFKDSQVATSETARDINRGIVLNLIRRRQPISRADLARISGLQRSTVSLIIEQLIRERWVISGPLGRLPRGRRPTFLQLNDRRAIVVVTVSEGIGVGIVSNGQLIRGLNGMAGEFGHVPLDLNGPQCGCGACGCWTRDSSPGTSCSVRYWASNCTRSLREAASENCRPVGLILSIPGPDSRSVMVG